MSRYLGHLIKHGTRIYPSLIQLNPHQCGICTAETKVKAGETKEFLVTQCLTAGSGHSLQKQDLSLGIKMLSQQSPSADWSPVMDGGRNPALSSNASTTALGSAWRATPAAGPAPQSPQASCHLLLPSKLSALSLLSDLEQGGPRGWTVLAAVGAVPAVPWDRLSPVSCTGQLSLITSA